MKLEDIGFTESLQQFRIEQNLDSFEVGRVISEHKERYIVKTIEDEYEGEIIGQLRFTAESRADFPAVGDWVAISTYDETKALIHAVYPRKTSIERRTAGKEGEKQIIATNIDVAFIMLAVDRDFNINRIERYLTICHEALVKPIILLNKIDLIPEEELNQLLTSVKNRIRQVEVFAVSNASKIGIKDLKDRLEKGKTYCLLGSSGVGKSSLLNQLSGQERMKTNEISSSTSKGRHVTSHRELLLLENGAMVIDNPGMREVGIADSATGLEATFDAIARHAVNCKFVDCKHISESDCAVRTALDQGELDLHVYENYLKMLKEKEHFESTLAERRRKDKEFGKMLKNYKKERK
jgi:ribosome biogenesis GTPase